MKLTFNKGIITFIDEAERTYTISINDNTIKNEKTNKILKNYPTSLISYLNHSFNCFDNLHLTNFRSCIVGDDRNTMRKELLFADKLASLNITFSCRDCLGHRIINFIKQNFAKFAKYRKENYTQEEVIEFYKVHYDFYEDYKLNKLCKYAARDTEEYEVLERWYRNHNETFDEEENKIPYIIYFLHHGLLDFCRYNSTVTRDYYSTSSEASRIIETYFNYCKALNREPQKGDIFKQIIEMSQTYTMKKSEIEAEAISAIKEKYFDKINFSTDDYFIHIPTTAKEFEEEANQMHNCVYRMYLPKVVAQQTIIVFVRKKDNPNASYITCEINKNTGKIVQFLCKFNNTPTDPRDKYFKELYQEFLDNNF